MQETAKALSGLNQNPAIEPAIKPISTYIFEHALLQHKDRDIKLLVAIILTEIIRILAPEPPFTDHDFRVSLIMYLCLNYYVQVETVRVK